MIPTGRSAEHLCQLLGIRRPVLLAPMAGISGGALAAEVTDAGGLGFIGGGYGDHEWIEREVGLAGASRFGIGLITWNMADGALEAVLSHRPAAVWLSFGDPSPHIAAVHDAGVLAVAQTGTVEEAVEAVDAGADVIVAQGSEAGGHGRLGMALPKLVAVISAEVPETPLVAAGGINNQRDLGTFQAFGAAGVALGSAFYATHEALDVDAAKSKIVDSGGADTIRSTVYDVVRGPQWPPGFTGRSIRTDLTHQWAGKEHELHAIAQPLATRHEQAVEKADVTFRVVWAGEGIGAIDKIRSAREIVERFAPIEGTEP